ncbi:MAG: glycosyltransferase family 2 protein [Bacteroidia bacterium]
MELSIIIPTKDRGDVFYKTLDAAYNAIKEINAEIIIVNDSKTSQPQIDRYREKVRLISNPKSGVAAARNFGAKNSKFSYLLFLDDDIIISKETIKSLSLLTQQYQDFVINFNWEYPASLLNEIEKTQFGRFLIKQGYTSLKGWSQNMNWDDKNVFEVDLLASYFLGIEKNLFNKIGGYNEQFPHAGAEDYEFAIRAKKTGIKCICNPGGVVLHNEEDRTEIKPWLQRKERSAETRKIAVNMGHSQLALNSSLFKRNVLRFIYSFKSFMFLYLELIPNQKKFDAHYSRIVNILLSAYLHKGYYYS